MIDRAMDYARKIFEGDASGHDFDHTMRVFHMPEKKTLIWKPFSWQLCFTMWTIGNSLPRPAKTRIMQCPFSGKTE